VTDADVVIVGAGPGGSAAAYFLARAGRDVLLLEKDAFPREKVCGDGLTPRGVAQLEALGLHDEAKGLAPGFRRSDGLRVHGGGVVLELPWPTLEDWPGHSVTCTRMQLDERLARHAVAAGARLRERTEVVGPIWHGGDGVRVGGVEWKDEDGRTGVVRAPVVIACDGASGRFAVTLGRHRREDRPLGVAVRTYYENPREGDQWLSSFLDLREGDDLLPGYGWIFPMADGTVNVGLGLLDTSTHFQKVSYRKLLDRWAAALPDEWGTTRDRQVGGVRSGALPMGFNRTPLHDRGVLLVGDAGGMVNPFNGEGIAYAMEAAQVAAEVADAALSSRSTAVLDRYSDELRSRWGGYYTLGRWFVELIGHPSVMKICTTYGMPHRRLMDIVMKLLANLHDARPQHKTDAVIHALSRLAPAS